MSPAVAVAMSPSFVFLRLVMIIVFPINLKECPITKTAEVCSHFAELDNDIYWNKFHVSCFVWLINYTHPLILVTLRVMFDFSHQSRASIDIFIVFHATRILYSFDTNALPVMLFVVYSLFIFSCFVVM